jgi:hypothetical protein
VLEFSRNGEQGVSNNRHHGALVLALSIVLTDPRRADRIRALTSCDTMEYADFMMESRRRPGAVNLPSSGWQRLRSGVPRISAVISETGTSCVQSGVGFSSCIARTATGH